MDGYLAYLTERLSARSISGVPCPLFGLQHSVGCAVHVVISVLPSATDFNKVGGNN